MSGANQIPKFARVNREGQLAPLSAIGTEFEQRVVTTVAASALTAAQFASDLLFNNAALTPYTGPTAVQMCQYFDTGTTNRGINPTAINSRFTMIWENSTATPMVVNLGAGFTPASITIPANTIQTVSFELSSVSPQTYRLFSQSTTFPASGSTLPVPPAASDDDVLVFDAASGMWVASITGAHPRGALDFIRTSAVAVPLSIEAFTILNPNVIPFAGAGNVELVIVPDFTFTNQFGLNVATTYGGLATNPAIAGDSLILTAYSAATFTPSNVVNTDVIDHIQCISNGGAPTTTVFRVDASGFAYAQGVVLASDAALKKNIENLTVDSKAFETLNAHRYHFTNQTNDKTKSVGLVAQDFMNVFPGVYVPANGPKKPASININAFNAMLIAALQDITKRLKTAEAHLASLEGRVAGDFP